MNDGQMTAIFLEFSFTINVSYKQQKNAINRLVADIEREFQQ